MVFEYKDPAEERVYKAITTYINKRYQELEREKRGKGFVMTIYRRRAASSPLALERSLERRMEGLRRVMENKAVNSYIAAEEEEEVDRRDLDDVPEMDSVGHISAALPSDPQVAQSEFYEVNNLLEQLRSLRGKDSRRDRFFDELRRVTDDGRSVLVFTEYRDTLEYIRDNLVSTYGKGLACYSGEGGERWDGAQWIQVSKDAITRGLKDGEIQVLICTDAASEGLNLQTAGALINYDLPWNPSKVEQRIGRIDRIGQEYPVVLVVNLFLKDSVDEQVYRVLRHRCGLFEHFVGAMQPVLARARSILLGQEALPDPQALIEMADRIDADHLQAESYPESDASPIDNRRPILSRYDLEKALRELPPDCGLTVKEKNSGRCITVSGSGLRKMDVSADGETLQRDPKVVPLTPESSLVKHIANRLNRTAHRLPLVIESYSEGGFRASIALWVDTDGIKSVENVESLRHHLEQWQGQPPDANQWLLAKQRAEAEARRRVQEMRNLALCREDDAIRAQVDAARERLIKELGRFLVCLGMGTEDLNGVLYQQMSRDISSAQRLRQVLQRLGGYPDWPEELRQELESFYGQLTENQIKARLLGRELDAALQDPRWKASNEINVWSYSLK